MGVVIALDEVARADAERLGWPTVLADSLTSASEGDYWGEVDRISRSWFRPGGTDLTVHDGLSLGDLVFFELGDSILYSLIRRAHLARAIVERFQPEEIVVAGEASSGLAKVIAAAAPGASVRTVGSRRRRSLRDVLDPRVIRLILRRAGVDRLLRSAVFRLGRIVGVFPPAPGPADRGKIFAVVDIPTGSIMDTVAPVVRRLGRERAVVVTTDPRAVAPLARRGIATRVADPARARWTTRQKRDAERLVDEQWRALDARLSGGSSDLQYAGLDLWPLIREDCRRLFKRRLPWALREIAATRTMLTEARPSLILTAADAHYSAQIFTLVGHQLGIPSLCIQHGAFGQPFGYLPVRASVLAVWGSAIRDWCLENGADGNRIAVTGQPRFDTLVERARAADRGAFLRAVGLDPTRQTILFAPESLSSCFDLARWMTGQMLSALESLPGMQVLARPHPSDSEAQHRGQIPPTLAARIVVSREGDAAQALGACDIVVLGQSTLGLEAMLVGRPVVMLLPEGGDSGAVPYAEEGAALRATSAAELRTAITALRDGDSRAAVLADGARKFVAAYHGTAPGEATGKVIALIERLVARGSPSRTGAAA